VPATLPDARVASYPDLRAVVFLDHVPDGAGEELPALYNSMFSTVEWFAVGDRLEPTGACVLEEPHHVILFHVSGNTIEILNKEFAIGPRSAERLCRALFRAFPSARRIHLEILFPPWELRLPRRILYWSDHMVVDLPETVDDYMASLGKSTRRELRRNWRRLFEAYPTVTTEMLMFSEQPKACIDELVAWKNQRFNARGEQTTWQTNPVASQEFGELVQRLGRIRVLRIDSQAAAITFTFPVGDTVYSFHSGFDPAYESFSLGSLETLGTISDAIRTGHKHVSLLWGQEEHKRQFGAKPHRATRLSVFRREVDRLHSLDEGWEVAWRNLREGGQRRYWRARHAAARQARRLGIRSGRGDQGDAAEARGEKPRPSAR
jgi:CelD/BcsL family acetyltransferase involved in cellulose biosynthesis